MLHLDQGGKNQLYTWYFGGLLKESPNLDFDVFGLSYYPMWHGTMEGLQYNLNYLATTYNKEVCVVETAYAWTTEDGDGEGNVFISGDEEVGGYPATVEGQFEFILEDYKNIVEMRWDPTEDNCVLELDKVIAFDLENNLIDLKNVSSNAIFSQNNFFYFDLKDPFLLFNHKTTTKTS